MAFEWNLRMFATYVIHAQCMFVVNTSWRDISLQLFSKASKLAENPGNNMLQRKDREIGFISKMWGPKIHLFCTPASQMLSLGRINSAELRRSSRKPTPTRWFNAPTRPRQQLVPNWMQRHRSDPARHFWIDTRHCC